MILEFSVKEKGNFLEDSVTDYFRHLGFNVQCRVRLRDRRDVSHEIDVLASKEEVFGTVTVAVECKYVKSPIGIKEIRNFHDKLMALGITKGIFISTAGFTSDAISHARSMGIELWDLKTLQEKINEIRIPEKDIIYDALPVTSSLLEIASPDHLTNKHLFTVTYNLNFKPFYFFDYHCFSQHTVAGNAIILESKGQVIVDAASGQIVDLQVFSGVRPTISSSGFFVECVNLEPKNLLVHDLPREINVQVTVPQIDLYQARELTKAELVKNIKLKYSYWTGAGRYLRLHTKIIAPKKKDIEIINSKIVKVPILFATFKVKDKTYERVIQAATGVTIKDDSIMCSFCRNLPTIICEKCGSLACNSHQKKCIVCGKTLCDNCIVKEGFLRKRYYCNEHKSAQA